MTPDGAPMGLARLGTSRVLLVSVTTMFASLIVTPDASAQFWEQSRPDGTTAFTHSPRGAGWNPIAFPGRTTRLYRRPPRREALRAHAHRYAAFLEEASALYRLPTALIRAVVHVESAFDPLVVSVDGAMGLMQLMPFTARKMGVFDPFDPRQNILGGARFLRILANQWGGDIVRTVASYNAGAGAVKKHGGVPPYAETQRYVRRVLAHFEAYGREQKPQTQAPTHPSAAAASTASTDASRSL